MKKISLIAGLLVLFWACDQNYIDDIETVDPGEDMEAPEVTINSPVEGAQIRVVEDVTSITIDLEVTDDIEIENVILLFNGEEIARFDDFPDFRRALKQYRFEEVPNGEHTLTVIATDSSGKTTEESVSFEKIEPYRPVYENEVFYVNFDGDFTELVTIQSPEVNGNPGFADGKIGRAYRGSSSGYLMYEAEHLQNEEFSAVFWYKTNADPNRAGLLVMGPPDEANPGSANNRTRGFRFFREAGGDNQRFKLNVGNGSGENWFDGGPAADIDPSSDEWAHLAITIGSTNCTVYINGEVVSTGEFPGIDWEGCDILSVGSGAPRFIGWGHLSTQSLMDELRIFDVVLTQEEIQDIMEAERQ
ncbi:LamG-like jellyroll fold domain-containing protein [Pleomorphovibrio marinus]|uniref:LamG-like jellyroll fold domain-containing protein n=1 Tax=Pleomorphovibrio marinus TaxID=2164132 RepID=UPI000E0BF81F|nr:LamG-like jellyroll fold domain-containing protein [Pleomorphovibrio marinus]